VQLAESWVNDATIRFDPSVGDEISTRVSAQTLANSAKAYKGPKVRSKLLPEVLVPR
jgi:hypothetical protein